MVQYLKRLGEISPLGYSAGVHIRFASPLYFKSTYPQEWQDLYAANAYSLRDPLVFWGVAHTGSTRWSDIALPDPFGVMDKAANFGLVYGAVASCGKITSRTIVGVGRSDREFSSDEIDSVMEVAEGLHDVTEPPEDLTPAMIEALRLIGDGYRHTAAAAEIGISESALKARLSSARDRLGARTTAEALRMAREYRLL